MDLIQQFFNGLPSAPPDGFLQATDLQIQTYIAAMVLPLLIALVQQPKWPKWFRTLVSCIICVGVAIWLTLANHAFDSNRLLRSLFVVILGTHGFYQAVWKFIGAKKVEDVSTLFLQWAGNNLPHNFIAIERDSDTPTFGTAPGYTQAELDAAVEREIARRAAGAAPDVMPTRILAEQVSGLQPLPTAPETKYNF